MSKVKSKWISGKELLERWNVSDFDLLEYRQKGLLVPYTKGFSQYMGQDIEITPLLDSLPQLPPGVSLPPGAADAIGENFGEKIRDELRNKLPQCLYKLEDVQKFEQEYGYNQTATSDKIEENVLKCNDLDAFVRNLRIEVENNSEITVQEPGKSPVAYDCRSIGFKNERTNTWKLFIRTLREKPHIFQLPSRTLSDGRRNKDYDSERASLMRMNRKVVGFLEKQFGIELPKDYKLFARHKPAGDGAYVFKFKMPDTHTTSPIEAMPKDTLLKKIESLHKKVLNTADADDLISELGHACSIAKNRGWM
ncbi:MAG: hypothetical protein JSV50_09085, partial [Desulfobacteraceae bacterium]